MSARCAMSALLQRHAYSIQCQEKLLGWSCTQSGVTSSQQGPSQGFQHNVLKDSPITIQKQLVQEVPERFMDPIMISDLGRALQIHDERLSWNVVDGHIH